jgi:hypothetical protein
MDKPPIQPATQTTTRPSPSGRPPARRSQLPGSGSPHPQPVLAVTPGATELPFAELPSPELPRSEAPAEPGEEPFSPGRDSPSKPLVATSTFDPLAQPLAFVSGGLVALLTLIVPLTSVLTDRRHLNEGGSIAEPAALPIDGSARSESDRPSR